MILLKLSSIALLLALVNIGHAQSIDHWETLVWDTTVRVYITPSADVASTWNTIDYDASAWQKGKGRIGYGDDDDNTITDTVISVYERVEFEVKQPAEIAKLLLYVDFDDGFIAYLNGAEIARAYMDNKATPKWNQTAEAVHEGVMYSGGVPERFTILPYQFEKTLLKGKNVLAIQTHNESTSSSDLTAASFLVAGINDTSTNSGALPNWFEAPVQLTSSNLPIVILNTNNQQIKDDQRIIAQMKIIDNASGERNKITDTPTEYNNNISIELRGSSSQRFAKKGYSFETQDSTGKNLNVPLMGMPAENDWILQNPYSDKSMMRNSLTYFLGRETGHYAPRTRYCEVVINGEYSGVYVLTEKIKRDVSRVNIEKLTKKDTTGNALTGGYIIKIDKTTDDSVTKEWTSAFPPYPGGWQKVEYRLHYPKPADMLPEQKSYIRKYVNSFEKVMNGPDFADPWMGYRVYIDVASFIDYLIIHELGKNVDGYRFSTFLYKNVDDKGGLLTMGPLWDYNLAYGNCNNCNSDIVTGWAHNFREMCTNANHQPPFWLAKMISDTSFQRQFRERWFELRKGPLHLDSLNATIDSMALELDEAQERNYTQYPILGTYVWPNSFVGETYSEEVEFLKLWLRNRVAWIDENMYGVVKR